MSLQRKTPLARVAFKEPKTEGNPKPPKSRKCAVKECRAQFVPEKPFQTWCGPEHGAVIAQAKLAKQKQAQVAAAKRAKKSERANDAARGEKIKTLHQLIAEAQKEFNAWIRWRDRNQPCICCGKRFFDKSLTGGNVHAGHYRSTGSAPHLRFNEDNVHLQNAKCNLWGAGRAVDYRIGLIARIGLDRVEALETNNEIHKWTHDEVRAIRDEYRARLRKAKKGAAI